MGVIDEHRIRARNVHPGFYDRCANQNIDLMIEEREHCFFKLVFFHLAVTDFNSGLWNDLTNFISKSVDGFNAVVDKINLSTARDLGRNGFTNCFWVKLRYESTSRQTIDRSCVNQTQITNPNECHIERSWNRSRRKCQSIDMGAKFFNFFFMSHAELLFFVYNQ
ncbi:hypothetical protein D3C87_1573920 [compost metagenome]